MKCNQAVCEPQGEVSSLYHERQVLPENTCLAMFGLIQAFVRAWPDRSASRWFGHLADAIGGQLGNSCQRSDIGGEQTTNQQSWRTIHYRALLMHDMLDRNTIQMKQLLRALWWLLGIVIGRLRRTNAHP